MIKDRYIKCCNYCKWLVPDDSGRFVGGTCQWAGYLRGEFPLQDLQQISRKSWFVRLNSPICSMFEHTIHNHFNIESPEYINLYSFATARRLELKWMQNK